MDLVDVQCLDVCCVLETCPFGSVALQKERLDRFQLRKFVTSRLLKGMSALPFESKCNNKNNNFTFN